MAMVNMLEAKSSLSRLVASVESGSEQEIVLARNGRPVARLVAMDAPVKQGVKVGLFDGEFPDISLEELNAADQEILKLFGIEG